MSNAELITGGNAGRFAIPSEADLQQVYGVATAALADMKTRLVVPDTTTEAGYKMAVSGIRECRELRVSIEAKRKDMKADSLAYGRAVDKVAKYLTEEIESIEEPIKAAKKIVDDRIENERLEAERKANEERLAVERARLAEERANLEAERERLAAERAAIEAEQRKQREALEAEQRKVQQQKAEADARWQSALDAERASTAEIERQRREAEEAERAKQEAAEREEKRLAALPEAEKLTAWMEEVREVVTHGGPHYLDLAAMQKAYVDCITEIGDALYRLREQIIAVTDDHATKGGE